MADEYEASQDEDLIARLYGNYTEVYGLEYDDPEVNGPCWESNYAPKPNGYCQIGHTVDGETRLISVHRLSWAYHNDRDIGEGMQICHHCDNPCCINPEHLFEDTHQGNMQDAAEKGRMSRTHQPAGEDHYETVLNWRMVFWIRMNCHKLTRLETRYRLYEDEGVIISEPQISLVITSDHTNDHNRKQWPDENWDSESKEYVGPPMNWEEDWGRWWD